MEHKFQAGSEAYKPKTNYVSQVYNQPGEQGFQLKKGEFRREQDDFPFKDNLPVPPVFLNLNRYTPEAGSVRSEAALPRGQERNVSQAFATTVGQGG